MKCCYWLCPDSTSTYYIHSEGNEIVQFTKGGSACDNECYVYGPNGRVASFINGEGPYYYLADHLNSTRAVLNNTGSVVSTHYYLPYGDASPNYGGETALDAPYKFSGKELDDEGGDKIVGFNLYYFGARNYDPLTCMWKQVDPMASKYPGLSPYNYCADNPVSNYDPDGNDYSYANNFLTWSFKRSLDNYWNNMVNSWQEFNAGMGWGAYSAAKSSVVGLGGFLADASTKSMAEAGYQYGIGIHYGITHASEIWDQYSADISNTWNSGPGGKGELIGYYGTKIGLAYLTTKGFGALSRTFALRGTSKLPTQIHHFATNKNKYFTMHMARIANKYGLSLDDAWNTAQMPHIGRHANEYHWFVLDGMKQAAIQAGDDPAKFILFYNKYVVEPIKKNPQLLRKEGWK